MSHLEVVLRILDLYDVQHEPLAEALAEAIAEAVEEERWRCTRGIQSQLAMLHRRLDSHPKETYVANAINTLEAALAEVGRYRS